jgi:hypothetical protein
MPHGRFDYDDYDDILDDDDSDEQEIEYLLSVLQRVVNGATQTKGKDSTGREYAHIPQDVLDLGRRTLKSRGVDPSKINER